MMGVEFTRLLLFFFANFSSPLIERRQIQWKKTYKKLDYYVAGMTGEVIFQVYDQDEIDSMIPNTICRSKENVVINDDLYFNKGKWYPAKRINNVEQGSYQVFCIKRNVIYGMIFLGKAEFDKYFVYLD